MPRVLAIDYGIKRCGIAMSDPLKKIANACAVWPPHAVMENLKKWIPEKEIDTIVVGYPVNMRSKKTEITKRVDVFVKQLVQTFPHIKIETLDERFTSKMADQTMLWMQIKKSERQKKENTDLIAASILLQNYLDFYLSKP